MFSLSKRPLRAPVFECNTGIRLKEAVKFPTFDWISDFSQYPRHKALSFLSKVTSRSFLRNKSLSIVGTNSSEFDSRHFRITLLN